MDNFKPRHTQISVSTAALSHNLAQVKRYAPNSNILSMVKANAYGHGIEVAVPALQNSDAFGVAYMSEAQAVRALTKKPILLIEGAFNPEEWLAAKPLNAHCVIHHQRQLNWALESVLSDRPVWLKVNTGMNRLGMSPKDAASAYHQLKQAGYDIILMMHFANADVPAHPNNQTQLDVFLKLKSKLEADFGKVVFSLCNSAGIIELAHHGDWVRPGLMLYGSSPILGKSASALGLQPTITLTAAVVAIQRVTAGGCVGYGSTWQAEQDSNIAIISCGYGDGYPVTSNSNHVKHAFLYRHGKHLPVVGRVSMDMLAVDVSGVDVAVGDIVELWGQHVSIDDVAEAAGTISYDIFCKITNRPSRATI